MRDRRPHVHTRHRRPWPLDAGAALGLGLVASIGLLAGRPGVVSLVLATASALVCIAWARHLPASVDARQRRAARRDPLTGLPHRDDLLEAGATAMSLGDVAVLVIDLDDFKQVNDHLGHAAGDAVLVETARRITRTLDADDLLTRLGADEFAVLVLDADRADSTAGRIVDAIRAPYHPHGDALRLDASVGLATTRTNVSIADTFRDADLAMSAAKQSGSGWRSFRPSMRFEADQRRLLASDLAGAIDRDQLSLRFQPIIGLESSTTRALEALVRWEHPSAGTIQPDGFIPLAESTGLIVPLGRWVLHAACRAAASWPGEDPPVVTVNLSARQLLDHRIVDDVRAALADHHLAPERLVLEVTETSIMSDPDLALERLHRLQAMGVGIAIDDFGTGHSSFEYLRRLPASTLKLARPFVLDLHDSPEDAALAAGIVDLAHTLGLIVVAEGIEHTAQQDALTRMGCDLAQGFLFDRPLTESDAIDRLLTETRPLSAAESS